jgi:ketosteroid isomerase-like protein
MSEDSTAPRLIERTRHAITSAVHGDFDAAMGIYCPGSVLDTSGMGWSLTFEGVAAIREVFEDWADAYEELEVEIEEILYLCDGVTLAVVQQRCRPVGSSGYVQMRFASVCEWAQGLIVWVTQYLDIDEARVAPSGSPSRGGP